MDNYNDDITYVIYCKLRDKLGKVYKIVRWMPKDGMPLSYEDFIKYCIYTHSNIQYRQGYEKVK